jgi:hypothetical protein
MGRWDRSKITVSPGRRACISRPIQLIAAVAEDDVLGGETRVRGERLASGCLLIVRIAMVPALLGERLQDARRGAVGFSLASSLVSFSGATAARQGAEAAEDET